MLLRCDSLGFGRAMPRGFLPDRAACRTTRVLVVQTAMMMRNQGPRRRMAHRRHGKHLAGLHLAYRDVWHLCPPPAAA